MNCEICPIREECENEKLAYFGENRFYECPLVEAARRPIRELYQIKNDIGKLLPEERKRIIERLRRTIEPTRKG
jgi:hypothetical protein